MKRIQREVTTYQEIFISVDGKEFNTLEDCKTWEKSYKCTLETSWQKIKKVEVNSANLGLPYGSEDRDCYIIKPKDLDEIAFINAYINGTTYAEYATLNTDHIGKVVALDFGYDHEYCDAYIVDGIIVDIAKYIEQKTAELEA